MPSNDYGSMTTDDLGSATRSDREHETVSEVHEEISPEESYSVSKPKRIIIRAKITHDKDQD